MDVAPSDAKLHYPVHKGVLGPQNLYLLKVSKYLIICKTKPTRWSQGDILSQLIIYYFVCVTFNDRKEFVGKISLCRGSRSQINTQTLNTYYKCSPENLGLSLVSSYNLNYPICIILCATQGLFTSSMSFPGCCFCVWLATLQLYPSSSQHSLRPPSPALLWANQIFINNESSTSSQCTEIVPQKVFLLLVLRKNVMEKNNINRVKLYICLTKSTS